MIVVGTIRCCSFYEFRQHFLVPPPLRVISVLKAIMHPLQEELWRVFFLPNNKPFGWAVCHTEETMKTSAVTIRKATKFIAM